MTTRRFEKSNLVSDNINDLAVPSPRWPTIRLLAELREHDSKLASAQRAQAAARKKHDEQEMVHTAAEVRDYAAWLQQFIANHADELSEAADDLEAVATELRALSPPAASPVTGTAV